MLTAVGIISTLIIPPPYLVNSRAGNALSVFDITAACGLVGLPVNVLLGHNSPAY